MTTTDPTWSDIQNASTITEIASYAGQWIIDNITDQTTVDNWTTTSQNRESTMGQTAYFDGWVPISAVNCAYISLYAPTEFGVNAYWTTLLSDFFTYKGWVLPPTT